MTNCDELTITITMPAHILKLLTKYFSYYKTSASFTYRKRLQQLLNL